MAEIVPFRGIMYNQDKIGNLTDVTTPPYDVISSQEQNQAYERHPQNIIRLILGKKKQDDTKKDNVYTRAALYFSKWQTENILIKDPKPALYFTSIEFKLAEKTMIRFGLVACVELEPFDKGVILPHEKTFSRVKSERLDLMNACHANFSPIFSLYSDPDNVLKTLQQAVEGKNPDSDFIDTAGHRQKLWRITDPVVHKYINDSMKSESLFIADGHHRYETALNYRNQLAEQDPDFSPDHPANYIMMYLSSMQDPGMIILPAHRMLKEIDSEILDKFISKIEKYFNVSDVPLEKTKDNIPQEFISGMKSGSSNTIGLFMKNHDKLYLLKLKDNIMEELFADELEQAVRNLDVTVLTRLIFMEILGFDRARLDNEQLIHYTTDPVVAVKEVLSGSCDMSFILNPTKIEQVQRIAQDGLVMPRKSTYFYPKVITGQVINPLIP